MRSLAKPSRRVHLWRTRLSGTRSAAASFIHDTWRRQLLDGELGGVRNGNLDHQNGLGFARVELAPPCETPALPPALTASSPPSSPGACERSDDRRGMIEIELRSGVRVRVGASRVACAFLVYMLPPLPRCSGWAYSSLISPSRVSLPRKGHRVGLHIVLFEACSAFTRVAACTLARSPYFVTRYPKASDISLPPYLLRLLPAGAVAGWDLHPLESAAFPRRTPKAVIGALGRNLLPNRLRRG